MNRLIWKFNTGGAVDSSPTVAYETVYIGSNSGRFYALDTRTGGIKWTFELKKYYLPTSAIVAEGVVYFNSDGGLRGGITHAVDAATGQEIWRFDRAGAYSSPAFDDGIVYIGSNRTTETQSYIESYGLDAKNGKVIWKFERKSEIVQGLLADTSHIIADGVVYFGSYDGYLYAVDIRTAKEKWRFEKTIREGCVPAIVQDVVYIQTKDSNLYCIDIETGVSKSSFKINGKFTGSIAVYRGVIYFGAGTKFFYAVDMKELQEKWKFRAEKMVGSPPSIAEGIIYFGSYDGYLYAVDITTGQEKWKYKTGKVVRCSPSIADGVVYFGSNDRYLYALSLSSDHGTATISFSGAQKAAPAEEYVMKRGSYMDIIRDILKEISEGRTAFKSASNSQSDMEDLQSVAKVIVYLNKQGWLDSFKEHRESRTANNWYDLISVTGLSYEGAQYLENIPSEGNATNSTNQEDIIDLKPNFMGLGVNFNALLRWWKKKKNS